MGLGNGGSWPRKIHEMMIARLTATLNKTPISKQDPS